MRVVREGSASRGHQHRSGTSGAVKEEKKKTRGFRPRAWSVASPDPARKFQKEGKSSLGAVLRGDSRAGSPTLVPWDIG